MELTTGSALGGRRVESDIADLAPGLAMSRSPDGTQLAFDGNGVSIMDVDGSNAQRIGDGLFPSWGP